MGGPAHHVTLLSGRLDPERYETVLVAGLVPPDEGSLDHLAADRGVRLVRLHALGPALHPLRDLQALVRLVILVRRGRPDVICTHTAKAGMLGRLAGVIARPRARPALVHTFHGHVLEGYFGRLQTSAYRWIERALGRRSDRLVGVSQATVDDLVRLGVGPADRFRVLPLGLDLGDFLRLDAAPSIAARESLGVAGAELVLSWVGRLVPIKRVDVALRALALVRDRGHDVRLLLVGGGELEAEMRALAGQLGIAAAVSFLGYRSDLAPVVAAADAALLTSDNEGTPVSLIEAAAAARPMVATDVGGVRDVAAGPWARLAPPDDPEALAAAITEVTALPAEERSRLGELGRAHVRTAYGVDRLLRDADGLYREILVAEAP